MGGLLQRRGAQSTQPYDTWAGPAKFVWDDLYVMRLLKRIPQGQGWRTKVRGAMRCRSPRGGGSFRLVLVPFVNWMSIVYLNERRFVLAKLLLSGDEVCCAYRFKLTWRDL